MRSSIGIRFASGFDGLFVTKLMVIFFIGDDFKHVQDDVINPGVRQLNNDVDDPIEAFAPLSDS